MAKSLNWAATTSSWRSAAGTERCSNYKLRASVTRPSRKGKRSMKLPDQMPGGLASMWRALKRGYQAEPRLLSVAFGLSLISALPDSLMAWWLKLMTDGITVRSPTLLTVAALGLAL